MCDKTRWFVNAVSASKVQKVRPNFVDDGMSGVIMTCMSDMRPGLVGSIATAGVGTYVHMCLLRLPMRVLCTA